MKRTQSTKDNILTAALDMFSVRGFTTVSVRDISTAVGIKESSIYYHFKNKEHILETILAQVELQTETHKTNFINELQVSLAVEREPFIAAGIFYIERYLLGDSMYKLIRMLTIEKQRNGQAAAIYQKLLFSVPLQHHTQVFTHLMQTGLIKQDEPQELAAEYQALIMFVFQKYFSGNGETTLASKAEAKQELVRLLGRFYERYM